MAMLVNQTIENMLPALEQFFLLGIVQRTEISDILKKRKAFEMQLISHKTKDKAPYLQYIQYEMALKRLVHLRVSQTIPDKAKKNAVVSLVDSTFGSHITHLFERACRMFFADVSMWLQYIDYGLHSYSVNGTINVMVKALKRHPNHTGLWIYLASFLFDQGMDERARVTLQRAIRIVDDVNLFYEYCRLELLIIKKIKDIENTGKNYYKGDLDGFADTLPPENTEKAKSKSQQRDAYLGGMIPKIIYENCIQKFPSLEVRMQFVSIFVNFIETSPTSNDANVNANSLTVDVDFIFDSILRDYAESPVALDFCARKMLLKFSARTRGNYEERLYSLGSDERQLEIQQYYAVLSHTVDSYQRILETYEDGNKSERTKRDEFQALFVNFLVHSLVRLAPYPDLYGPDNATTLLDASSQKQTPCNFFKLLKRPFSQLYAKFVQSLQSKRAPRTQGLFLLFASSFLKLGAAHFPKDYLANAIEILALGSKLFPTCILFWSERLRLMGTLKSDPADVERVFNESLAAIEDRASTLPLQQFYLLYRLQIAETERLEATGKVGKQSTQFALNLDLFRVALSLPAPPKDMNDFKQLILSFLYGSEAYTYEEKRRFCLCALESPSNDPVNFFNKMIESERQREIVDAQFIRSLYEKALLAHGKTDAGLWLSFIAFEREQLRLKEASLLYWRAVKELKDVTSFITEHNLMNSSSSLQFDKQARASKTNSEESSSDDESSDDDSDDTNDSSDEDSSEDEDSSDFNDDNAAFQSEVSFNAAHDAMDSESAEDDSDDGSEESDEDSEDEESSDDM